MIAQTTPFTLDHILKICHLVFIIHFSGEIFSKYENSNLHCQISVDCVYKANASRYSFWYAFVTQSCFQNKIYLCHTHPIFFLFSSYNEKTIDFKLEMQKSKKQIY
eukprot:NODE_163_length_14820_cov_0.686502.p4 type:complete len:106 gc:universal NODE_163_length_14820_cov_0.686502:11216-11533(+)